MNGQTNCQDLNDKLDKCAISFQEYGKGLKDNEVKKYCFTKGNWMGEYIDYYPEFGKKKIYQICIPGTHHSGFLGSPSILNGWSKPQKLTITQQLLAGIRMFDFRVCDDTGTHGIVISHTIASRYRLENALNEVHTFLSEHTKEIVILWVRKDKKRKLSENGVIEIRDMLVDVFGDMILPNTLKEAPITELLKHGQVILEEGVVGLGEDVEWDGVKSWEYTKEGSRFGLVENLIAFNRVPRNTISITEAVITPKGIFGVLKYIGRGKTNLMRVGSFANKDLLFILNLKNMKLNLNVYMHDNTNSQIINKIIGLNKHRV